MCQIRAFSSSHLNMGQCHGWSLLSLLTLFGLIFQGSDGVKDVQLEGPRYARRGEDLMLRCNYDLETDSLYAVKWYRGSEEFYRFLPKEAPPKQAFPIPGVVVDVNKSDDHSVFLRNLSFETNGRFKCVISAEGTFQTLNNAKDLDVVVIDYNSPRLYLDKMSYQPGDRAIANCSIEKTYPAPNITWFINGKKVNLSVLTKVEPVLKEENQRRTRMRTTPGTTIPAEMTTTTTLSTLIGGGVNGNGSSSFMTTGASTAVGRNMNRSSEEPASASGDLYKFHKLNKGMKMTMNAASGGGSEDGKNKLTSTVSTLSFPIQSYSPLTIKCTGQLYDVYNETSSIQIQPKAPIQRSHYPTMATPNRSRQNYGLPDQLQTFNATTRMMNDATSPTPLKTLMAVTLLTLALFPLCSIRLWRTLGGTFRI